MSWHVKPLPLVADRHPLVCLHHHQGATDLVTETDKAAEEAVLAVGGWGGAWRQ